MTVNRELVLVDHQTAQVNEVTIKKPPIGLAVLAFVGPSFVWCAEYIGSGEVIIATRTGAILGTTVLWAVIMGVFLKFWIGISGARYTVCTGEGMIDMLDRMPGPRHWAVWMVLVIQLLCGILTIGTLASASGAFLSSLMGGIDARLLGWFSALFAIVIVWSGIFDVLKFVMSAFVIIVVLGALYIAAHVFPSFHELMKGFRLSLPDVPQWAASYEGVSSNPWEEILPVLGWGAGGFASQVWYTYWVLGAGYGMAAGRGYGRPADTALLKNMTASVAQKVKGWCHVLYVDASLAMIIGIMVTGAFLISGAGILGVVQKVPTDTDMADVLSKLFSDRWNVAGGIIFKVCGAAAMLSTLIGLLAGWPRLMADSFRICFPLFGRKLQWKWQFRLFVVFFFITSMVVVFSLGLRPVFLAKLSSILEGVMLTALQALWVAVGLFIVLPRLLPEQAYAILKPSRVFAVGLMATSIFFGYVCITQIPKVLGQLLGKGG